MKHFFLLSVVLFFGVLAAACQAPQQKNTVQPVADSQVEIDQAVEDGVRDEASAIADSSFKASLEAQLTDVTEGNDLSDGINTGGAAVGIAEAGLLNTSRYLLQVEIVGLPELPEGYFYEGWLINSDVSPFSVISTGALDNEDGVTYTNVFDSETDYTNHLEYVLTLEPDDGDPAPAEHVASGVFQGV